VQSTWVGNNPYEDNHAYTLQIQAEVAIIVERTSFSWEILQFGFGNLVYECFECLLETGSHCRVRYVGFVGVMGVGALFNPLL